jgi:hypothetical protein
VPVVQQALETLSVQLPFLDAEQVAGSPGDDAVAAEESAELGDVDLQRRRRRLRRAFAPQLGEQPLGGDDVVPVQEQNGEQRALSPSGERE